MSAPRSRSGGRRWAMVWRWLRQALKKAGVAEVFQPGASMQQIVEFIRDHAKEPA